MGGVSKIKLRRFDERPKDRPRPKPATCWVIKCGKCGTNHPIGECQRPPAA